MWSGQNRVICVKYVHPGGCRETTGGNVEKYFGSSGGAAATGIQQAWRGQGRGVGVCIGKLSVREGRDTGFWYAGMETGDAQVGGWSCFGGGRGRWKMTAEEALNRTEGGEGGAGLISKICNNKWRSLGLEWLISEVATPPPHNLDKTHGLVASINNNSTYTTFNLYKQNYQLMIFKIHCCESVLWLSTGYRVFMIVSVRIHFGATLNYITLCLHLIIWTLLVCVCRFPILLEPVDNQ